MISLCFEKLIWTLELTTMGSVCLTCGSDGLPECLFFFCNKYQVYALHRYCLDGPVIFDDDVTWFCEDCQPEKPPSLESSTSPMKNKPQSELEKDTIPAYLKLKNHVKRVKKNYRKRRKIMKKQKELKDVSGCLDQSKVELSNCPNSTSHRNQNHLKRSKNNNHGEQKKFMKKQKETPEISSDVSIRLESSPDCHTCNHNHIQCKKSEDVSGNLDESEVELSNCPNSTSHHNQNHLKRSKNSIHEEQKKLMKKQKEAADISGDVSIRRESSPDCHTSNLNTTWPDSVWR